MYRIIGADQKEYGPVSADQIRHWLAENRVTSQTRIKAEGTGEWKPLCDFPEFGLPPSMAPMSSVPAGSDRISMAGPAISLIVTAVLNVLLGIFQLLGVRGSTSGLQEFPLFRDPEMAKFLEMAEGPAAYAANAFAILIAVVVLVGALRMYALKNYGLAFTASVLAMIPCITPCCLLGLPFGIWAVIMLSKPEVKAQFQ